MSNKERLEQHLEKGMGYKKLEKKYIVFAEYWWNDFLDAYKTDIKAEQMFDSVNWEDKEVVSYLLDGLYNGSFSLAFFKPQDEFGNDNQNYDANRLLRVCGVLKDDEHRVYMASIVNDYLTDSKYEKLREEILTILKPGENKETSRVNLGIE